jgi:hypothetical protein
MSFLKVAAVAVAVSGGILTFAPAEAQAQGYGYYGHGYGHQNQYVHPKVAKKIAKRQARLARQQAWEQQYYYSQARPRHYGYAPSYYGHGYHQPRTQSFSYSFGW